jgi:hypothetical protein
MSFIWRKTFTRKKLALGNVLQASRLTQVLHWRFRKDFEIKGVSFRMTERISLGHRLWLQPQCMSIIRGNEKLSIRAKIRNFSRWKAWTDLRKISVLRWQDHGRITNVGKRRLATNSGFKVQLTKVETLLMVV